MEEARMATGLSKVLAIGQRIRIPGARVLSGLLFLFVLLTPQSWSEESIPGFVIEEIGLSLIIIGAFGRVWAALYVSGRKGRVLVTAGPYSVCRHPLYLSSLTMGLGIVAALQNLLLLLPLALFHLESYFLTILAEERELTQRFGPQYEDYRKGVPRLFPAFWRYRRGGDTAGWMRISERLVLKCLFESALFVLIVPVAEAIEKLNVWGVLPLIFRH
jgi:protein-S-isoprenylcysteine O-methyltransferase Ste14